MHFYLLCIELSDGTCSGGKSDQMVFVPFLLTATSSTKRILVHRK